MAEHPVSGQMIPKKFALAQWNGDVPWSYEGLQTALLADVLDQLQHMTKLLNYIVFNTSPKLKKRIAQAQKKRPAKKRSAKKRKTVRRRK